MRRRRRGWRSWPWFVGIVAGLVGAGVDATRDEPALWLVLVVLSAVVVGALIVLEVVDRYLDDPDPFRKDHDPPDVPPV